MRRHLLSTLVLTLTVLGLAHSAEQGLVGQWSFNEGQGATAHDGSGNGNDGTVHDAQWVRNKTGYCLEFDGQTSWVDCGAGPSLDLRKAATLEAWVFPTGQPRGEPGIFGKQFESYLVTYYTDANAYFYVGSGANNAHAPLAVGAWSLITATFDGKTQSVYLNGKLLATHASTFDQVPQGGRFTIGMVVGRAEASDPAYRNTARFEGLVDEVRVFDRALSAEEIAAHAQAAAPQFELTEDYRTTPVATTIKCGATVVSLGKTGQLQLSSGKDRYVVNSYVAYPGEAAGWNGLSAAARSESGWQPRVRRLSDTSAEVTARGSLYSLRRRVEVKGPAVEITDTLRSLSAAPVGIMTRHDVICRDRLRETFSAGGAETPFMYVHGPQSALGVLMEDDLSRLRFEPRTAVRVNACSYRLGNLALDTGKALTFKWTLLPLSARATYFDLVNVIRKRWNSNYTVQGPLSWIDMQDPLLSDPAKLKAYLRRKRLGVMLLSPWLDYDPGAHDRVWSREEYKAAALKAVAALKAAQPDLKCLGCIECDWVALDPKAISGGEKLPVYGQGSGGLTREQTGILLNSGSPWADSIKIDVNGTTSLELYSRGGKSQTSLWVYPAPGNYQAKFLMEQVQYLIDDVKLDGFYIDEFSQAWSGGFRVYSGWDGVSADLNAKTGQIVRKYTDAAYVGTPVRVALVKYALDRGKTVVCNTYASAMAETGLPANRFSETWNQFDPFATPTGQKPGGLNGLFRSNLASPIGLGILGHPEKHDTAQRLMKALVTYLRHGMVYYHYFLEDIPETGDGSGEYGPVNHMMPITPVALGEGFIVGRERTVTCVSGTYEWTGAQAPSVLVFDMNGRQVEFEPALTKTGKGWRVGLKLQDWAQIAVIE